MKNKNIYLVAGQFSLAVSILLNHFVKDNAPVSFFIGLFTGLSIVFNIAFLLAWRKDKSI
ncbi:MAG: hypothetical protein IPM32_00215 [Ignavibacteriae bacterium]|nr:hypothetical protein [Ignavibacteriota bacterium]